MSGPIESPLEPGAVSSAIDGKERARAIMVREAMRFIVLERERGRVVGVEVESADGVGVPVAVVAVVVVVVVDVVVGVVVDVVDDVVDGVVDSVAVDNVVDVGADDAIGAGTDSAEVPSAQLRRAESEKGTGDFG